MASKVTLDNKRRGSFGPDFRPGDTFLREVNGETVTFRKLAPATGPILRARKVKGRWIGAALKVPAQAIVDAIREDRESK
jgi:hypothetical protein